MFDFTLINPKEFFLIVPLSAVFIEKALSEISTWSMLFIRRCLAALSDHMISSNLGSVELRIKLTRLSTNLTEEVPICIDTIPSLNFKLAFCLRRNASPRFKSWLRFFITIGAIRIGLSMFSIYIKKGLALPIIVTG